MSTFVFGVAVWGVSAVTGAAVLAAASLIALRWAILIVTALRRLGTAPQRAPHQRPQGR